MLQYPLLLLFLLLLLFPLVLALACLPLHLPLHLLLTPADSQTTPCRPAPLHHHHLMLTAIQLSRLTHPNRSCCCSPARRSHSLLSLHPLSSLPSPHPLTHDHRRPLEWEMSTPRNN